MFDAFLQTHDYLQFFEKDDYYNINSTNLIYNNAQIFFDIIIGIVYLLIFFSTRNL